MAAAVGNCQSPSYEFPRQCFIGMPASLLRDGEEFAHLDPSIVNAGSSSTFSPTRRHLESPASGNALNFNSPVSSARHRTLPAVPSPEPTVTRSGSVNVRRVRSSLRRRFSFTNPFDRKNKRRPFSVNGQEVDQNAQTESRLTADQSVMDDSTLVFARSEASPNQERAVKFSPLPVVERRADRGFRNPFARKEKHKSLDAETYNAESMDCDRAISASARPGKNTGGDARSSTLDSRVVTSTQSPSASSPHSETTLLEKIAVSCRSLKLRFRFADGDSRQRSATNSGTTPLKGALPSAVETRLSEIAQNEEEQRHMTLDEISGYCAGSEASSSLVGVSPPPPCVPPRDPRNRGSMTMTRPRSEFPTTSSSGRSRARASVPNTDGVVAGAEASDRSLLVPAVAARSSSGQNMEFIQSLCDLKEVSPLGGQLLSFSNKSLINM